MYSSIHFAVQIKFLPLLTSEILEMGDKWPANIIFICNTLNLSSDAATNKSRREKQRPSCHLLVIGGTSRGTWRRWQMRWCLSKWAPRCYNIFQIWKRRGKGKVIEYDVLTNYIQSDMIKIDIRREKSLTRR